jgi:hypothetical protein
LEDARSWIGGIEIGGLGYNTQAQGKDQEGKNESKSPAFEDFSKKNDFHCCNIHRNPPVLILFLKHDAIGVPKEALPELIENTAYFVYVGLRHHIFKYVKNHNGRILRHLSPLDSGPFLAFAIRIEGRRGLPIREEGIVDRASDINGKS